MPKNDVLREMGFLTLPDLAEVLDKSERTIQRYKSQPDGLPFADAGGVEVTTLEWFREWIISRKRQKNPTRTGRAA